MYLPYKNVVIYTCTVHLVCYDKIHPFLTLRGNLQTKLLTRCHHSATEIVLA